MSLTMTENPPASTMEVGEATTSETKPSSDGMPLGPAAPASRDQKLSFNQLPTDIKSSIARQVTRPSDMKNLAFTCKEMHEIVVPYLYYEISLDVGSQHDNQLSAFLNPQNIGLKYIRYLDVYLAEVIDKCNQIQQANFAIRMILEFLPENILEKFSWHPWSSFSQDNMLLLYRKQRKVRWREGIRLDRFDGFFDEIGKMPWLDDSFKHTRKLGLYPDSREVLEFCNFLVKKTPKLEKITLHASFDDNDSPIPQRELHDSSVEPGLITSTLFSHLMPFEHCTPMALRDLTLQKINLRHSRDTYCRFIDCTGLKSIRLTECAGADAFLSELTRSSRKLPMLLETLEFKHEDNCEEDALNALNGFLCVVTGIRTLVIDMTGVKELPAPASIIRHYKTLQELTIHTRPDRWDSDEKIYTYEQFNNICQDCQSLEQLSLGFPATTAHRTESDGFRDYKAALSELRQLITLNITTWPSQASGTRLPRKIYEHLLQSMACDFFVNAPPDSDSKMAPKLAVVAFGSSDKVYDREDSKNQITFVKSKTIDPFGKEGFTASKVGWCLRKYIEPRSEILDYSLTYTKAPPTSERDSDS